MTRDKLLCNICPIGTAFDCRTGYKSCNCYDCNRVLEEWLDDYDKHVIEQYKADTNLKDTIREIHDNVAREMYCKGIDDLTEKLKQDVICITFGLRSCDIDRIAEELKEQNK